MPSVHLAFDLGASSGRAIVGVLEGDPPHLRIEEVHRFEHHAVATPAGPVWDITGIWGHLLLGLHRAASWCNERQLELATVGVDTWGVDWTLLGPGGELLGLPRCYRDPANEQFSARVLEQVGGFEALYARTGIQLLPFNTLFQVAGRLTTEPTLFDPSHRLVFLPDLFHYWFSGKVVTESSIASTSAMLDVHAGDWDLPLLEQVGIPSAVLGRCVPPGTTLGPLRTELASAAGLKSEVQVVTPAAHDTASAIAAVPASESDSRRWAYLSSGTWSCMGLELISPLATPEAAAASFTNERGVGGTFRFLKNIAGLWLVQELRREWNAQGEQHSFEDMVELARGAPPFRTLVDPNYGEFASPGDMAAKLQAFAQRTGQPEPTSPGELVRTCLESLALSYRHTCDKLERLADTTIDLLHVVGGGSQNNLLNQMTADALQRPVVCGPAEATAIGNLLVQAMSTRQVKDLADLRDIVCRSSAPTRFEPTVDRELQSAAQQRFSKLATW